MDKQVLECRVQSSERVMETAYILLSKPSDKDILMSKMYSILSSVGVTYTFHISFI